MQRIVGILVLLFLATAIGGNISSNVYGSSQLPNGLTAAKVTDTKKENDNLSTEEKADLINQEVEEEEDTPTEENALITKGNDDTIADENSRSQSEEDAEVDKDTESQIPSSILRFILEP